MLLTLFIVFTSVQVDTVQAANADTNWLNTSKLNQGIIGISYKNPNNKTVKLMITKGASSYTYNLLPSVGAEDFPLQQGNGTYKVSVLENTTGNKYKALYSEEVNLSINNTNSVYLKIGRAHV